MIKPEKEYTTNYNNNKIVTFKVFKIISGKYVVRQKDISGSFWSKVGEFDTMAEAEAMVINAGGQPYDA